MQPKHIALLILVLCSHFTWGQFQVQVGQSSDNSYTKLKDALIQYTNPADNIAASSWLVNGFIEVGYKTDKNHTFGASYELGRNTLIKKIQHVEQWGINGLISLANSDATFELPISIAAKYSNDKIENKEESQFLLSTTIRCGSASPLTTESLIKMGNYLAFTHNHSIGVAALDFTETVFAQAYFELNAHLFHDFFYEKKLGYDVLSFKTSWNGRTALAGDLVNGRRLIKYGFMANINFDALFGKEPDKSDEIYKLGIKAEWTDGADPLKGLKDQKFMIVALSLTIKT